MSGILREINIKYDMPTTDEAIKRITYEIWRSKTLEIAALKIIHGYGSGGRGGKIRQKARLYLESQKKRGSIKDIIDGESFSIFDESTRKAFNLCSDLRSDPDLERHNNGITIVII